MNNSNGETPFIIAAREGKLEIIKMYVDKYEKWYAYDIDEVSNDGWTALLYASMNGYKSIVEYLIKNKANINCTDKMSRSALHWACRFNNLNLVKLLLQYDIKIDLHDSKNLSALDIARKYDKTECIEEM